jgi:hypothetical protein
MTESSKNGKDKREQNNNSNNQSTGNIFKIMDGIIQQLNNTKKMFIIMIITIMIIPPLSFAITYALFGPPFSFQEREQQQQQLPSHGFMREHIPLFGFTRLIPIIISIIWLGIGIRQWFVLSKWTKKYQRYKELQSKIDERLDYDMNNDEK